MVIAILEDKIKELWSPYFTEVKVIKEVEFNELETKLQTTKLRVEGYDADYNKAIYTYDLYELLGVRPEILDYIIIHPLAELADTLYMTNSKLSPGRH